MDMPHEFVIEQKEHKLTTAERYYIFKRVCNQYENEKISENLMSDIFKLIDFDEYCHQQKITVDNLSEIHRIRASYSARAGLVDNRFAINYFIDEYNGILKEKNEIFYDLEHEYVHVVDLYFYFMKKYGKIPFLQEVSDFDLEVIKYFNYWSEFHAHGYHTYKKTYLLHQTDIIKMLKYNLIISKEPFYGMCAFLGNCYTYLKNNTNTEKTNANLEKVLKKYDLYELYSHLKTGLNSQIVFSSEYICKFNTLLNNAVKQAKVFNILAKYSPDKEFADLCKEYADMLRIEKQTNTIQSKKIKK